MVFFAKLLILTVLPALSSAADLGSYQLILDRQLLGTEEPVTQQRPPVAPPPVSASWADEYVMTMISKDPSGLRVGLQHKRNGQAFLLLEGDDHPSEQFKLVSGDFESGTATVRFGNQSHRFAIETGPAVSSQESRASSQASSPSAPRRRRSIRPEGSTQSSAPREEDTSEPRFRSREELQQHLREQQLDAIRTGKPPLPIPVTDDMVDQLIQEGWSLPSKN